MKDPAMFMAGFLFGSLEKVIAAALSFIFSKFAHSIIIKHSIYGIISCI